MLAYLRTPVNPIIPFLRALCVSAVKLFSKGYERSASVPIRPLR